WILDQIFDPAAAAHVWENVDFTGERVAAMTTLLVVVFLAVCGVVSFVPPWLPVVVGSVLSAVVVFLTVVGYRSHPYHARRLAATERQTSIRQRLSQVEGQLAQLREDFHHATAVIRERRRDYNALESRMRSTLAAIDGRHANARADCERQMRNLDEQELDALDEVDYQLQQTLGALTRRLNVSHTDEQSELAQTLAQL